jgi:hypothetical protein
MRHLDKAFLSVDNYITNPDGCKAWFPSHSPQNQLHHVAHLLVLLPNMLIKFEIPAVDLLKNEFFPSASELMSAQLVVPVFTLRSAF